MRATLTASPTGRGDSTNLSALAPCSLVRIRTASFRSMMKILPSPIWPVRAARGDLLDHLIGHRIVDRHLELDLRNEVDLVFGAAIDLLLAALTAIALDLGQRHPLHVGCRSKPSRTASSLCGLMMAMMYFMDASEFQGVRL